MLLYFSVRALILQSTSTKWLASAHPPHSTGSCTRISVVRPLHIVSSCLFCHWTRVQNMIASWLGSSCHDLQPSWLASQSLLYGLSPQISLKTLNQHGAYVWDHLFLLFPGWSHPVLWSYVPVTRWWPGRSPAAQGSTFTRPWAQLRGLPALGWKP